MIGYAITTTPERYDKNRDYFKNVPEDAVTYLHNDKDHLGMASSKNECIKTLYDAGCDWFVLMDDDTRILKKGFGKFLVECSRKTSINHFIYPGRNAKLLGHKNINGIRINNWNKGSGVLLFCSRKVIDNVGYLNIDYPYKWGLTHIAWSIRIIKAMLVYPFKSWRLSPKGIKDYFWSDDIDSDKGEGFDNFTEQQKRENKAGNLKEYKREIRDKKLYYEYATKSTLHK